jgi:hypothetical protein
MKEMRATECASNRQRISKTMACDIPQFSPFHKPQRIAAAFGAEPPAAFSSGKIRLPPALPAARRQAY